MALNVSRILRNYHLVLTALSFIILFIIIIDDTIDYYINGRYYEGFMLVWQIVLYGFFNMPLLLPYLIKGDYRGLGKTTIILTLLVLIGFAGFAIPLTVLPVVSIGLAIYYLTMANKLDLSTK